MPETTQLTETYLADKPAFIGIDMAHDSPVKGVLTDFSAFRISVLKRGSWIISDLEMLPLAEQIRLLIDVFEDGCSNSGGPEHLAPEDCPTCARSLVDAIKKAIQYEPLISEISSV